MPRTKAGQRLVEMFRDSRRLTASLVADAIEAEAVAAEQKRWSALAEHAINEERERITQEVAGMDGWKAGTLPGLDDTVPRAAVLAIVNRKDT